MIEKKETLELLLLDAPVVLFTHRSNSRNAVTNKSCHFVGQCKDFFFIFHMKNIYARFSFSETLTYFYLLLLFLTRSFIHSFSFIFFTFFFCLVFTSSIFSSNLYFYLTPTFFSFYSHSFFYSLHLFNYLSP